MTIAVQVAMVAVAVAIGMGVVRSAIAWWRQDRGHLSEPIDYDE